MRPRFNEKQTDWWQQKQLFDKQLYKVLIFSDCHGWLADLSALRCINKVLQHNKFDEVIINGDVTDMPYISKHSQKLYQEGILKGYTEVGEIEYTKEQILKPLRLSTDAKIRVRLGNHDERITNPYNLGDKQLARLAVLYKYYNSTKYNEMLDLKESDGFIYDESDVYNLFNIFDITHGLSLNKTAAEKNIYEYMGSGSTGHTHRLNSKYLTNRKNPYVWLESGCTRLTKEVEFFPTGKTADWQQGFIEVVFTKAGFFAQPTLILNGECYYNGIIYKG
jgi:predicted phosphodiesterase